MAANTYFLGGIDLADVVLARVDEREAVDTYTDLIAEVRARCGPEVASIFAEPIRGSNTATGANTITWYSAWEGTPFSLKQLDPTERAPVIDLLKQRLRSFSALFGDARGGAILGSWLYVLSADSIMAVAGQPVIKNWGMVPKAIAMSEEARDTHFRNTVGLYLPNVPTPPFLEIEAQSFAGGMSQLAGREMARAARETMTIPETPAAPAAVPPAAPTPAPAPAVLVPSSTPAWRAPAIASGIAAAVVLLLLFGHLLRYPTNRLAPDAAAIEAQRATNQALQERLDQLTRAARNVCQTVPGTPVKAGGVDVQPLLPPSPTQTKITTTEPGQPAQVEPLGVALEKATVLVKTSDGFGSGFFITDRTIITNHHVVGDERTAQVGSKALGGFFPATVKATGAGRERGTQDIAVLELDQPRPGSAALQLSVTPQRMEPVTASGYPGAVVERGQRDADGALALPEANFTQGIVTERQNQAPDGIATIYHTAQIGHGNSGGPLVDAGGCVVGINSWAAFDQVDGTIYGSFFQALDASELRKFLQAHDISFSATDKSCKPTTAAVTPAPAPQAPAPQAPAPAPRP